MDTQTLILIVIGVVLLVALVLLLGGGMAMGGMMMAGMMATPVGWAILLIILAVAALVGYIAFYG